MALQKSVAVRNAQLDSIETTVGTSAKFQIRSGTPPSNCAAADTGTLLAEATLPSDWMANASSGSKALSGTWQDASADASGYAGHFRVKDSGGTTCHMQGTCGMSTSGTTAWAGSTAYSIGNIRRNGSNVYICTTAGTSASSGGPTGTGTGITDGTCVWNYLCPLDADLNLDNAAIASGQVVTISSFTITAGGA